MAEGRLQVIVNENISLTPIQGASVVVSTGDEVLYRLFTDESGKTDFITLEAPPLSYSLEPGEPQPYAQYDIAVKAEGYGSVYIFGVQVYAESEALQNVLLIRGGSDSEIVVPPPVLYGNYPAKIIESEVKPLPPETGFAVLDRVVIPEYIVVHDGTPNSQAKNYYVPYKDYIKNVASGEIYSTWGREAIKANVYAIQSFTLNRVFTEWYRNKGFDFTITSSTAYDQSFSYGRTIYESISEVVDEIFNEYIRRDGQIQPLFAQYCDGIQVSCPGQLTQWGSEDLAQQGYTAIEILRYFYGDDISIVTAERIAGIPYGYPGTPFEIGSSGNDVRRLQQQLNTIADTYTAIDKIRVDGIFGPATENAVKEFQSIFNLPQTGIIDKATFYEISGIYVALERLAELR